MPWSNQGGGPGDQAAAQGPWGSGRSRPVPTPPILAEFLRPQHRDRLRTVLAGRSPAARG
jgi:hypothetical protein